MSGTATLVQILVQIGPVRAFSLDKVATFWLVVYHLLGHAARSNLLTDLYTLWLKRRHSAQGRVLSGLRPWATSLGQMKYNVKFLVPA